MNPLNEATAAYSVSHPEGLFESLLAHVFRRRRVYEVDCRRIVSPHGAYRLVWSEPRLARAGVVRFRLDQLRLHTTAPQRSKVRTPWTEHEHQLGDRMLLTDHFLEFLTGRQHLVPKQFRGNHPVFLGSRYVREGDESGLWVRGMAYDGARRQWTETWMDLYEGVSCTNLLVELSHLDLCAAPLAA